jgi:hypothetical protein
MTQITPEILKQLIRQTVLETLSGLGFQAETPAELQADMYYLRRMRKGSEEMARKIRMVVLSTLLSTGLYLLWEAIRQQLGR